MNRNEILPRINTFLGRFTQEVKQLNAASLYDINIHSENVLIPLIREVYGFDSLQNANAITKNAAVVDLIDFPNRVSIQVTSTSDAQKISDTLTAFTKNDQQRAFDRILFYIISEKQSSYRKDFNSLLPKGFDFDTDRDIIDNSSLLEFISRNIVAVKKLSAIEKILSDEFSEFKIQERELKQQHHLSNLHTSSEQYFPNLVRLELPYDLYQADISIDFNSKKEELIDYLKGIKNFRKIRHISGRDIVNFALGTFTDKYSFDFIVRNRKIYTFKNLNNSKEPFRKVIDLGTITVLTLSEYIDGNEDRLNNMRDLVNSTLRNDFAKRQIEWVDAEKVYRFQIGKALNSKKVEYKGKGKRVIHEILSKDETKAKLTEDGTEKIEKGKHIVCFRHLSFISNIFDIEGYWFMSIKPDWTFTTSYDGKSRSKYAEFYTKGIKEFEWNDTLFDQFKFLSEYLSSISSDDMFEKFVIKIQLLEIEFNSELTIPDNVWNQSEPKTKFNKSQLEMFGE